MVQELPVVKPWAEILRRSFPTGSAIMKNRHYRFMVSEMVWGSCPDAGSTINHGQPQPAPPAGSVKIKTGSVELPSLFTSDLWEIRLPAAEVEIRVTL